MLYNHQIKITDFYNIPIGNVKELAPNIVDKERYVPYYGNFQLSLRLGLKIQKIHRVLEFNRNS